MAGIEYTPTLSQVLARENIFDTSMVPLTDVTQDIGTLLKRVRRIYLKDLEFLTGSNITIYASAVPLYQITETYMAVPGMVYPTGTTADLGSYGGGPTGGWWRNIYLTGSVKADISNLANREYFYHFDHNPITIYLNTAGVKMLNDSIMVNAQGGTITQALASEIILTSGAVIGNDIYIGIARFYNPADFTYLEAAARLYVSAVTMQNEAYIELWDDAGQNLAYVSNGTNPGSIAFHTTPDGGVSVTTTDNLVLDMTSYQELKIQIKSGTIRLLKKVAGVWTVIATHITNVFYNVAAGVYPIVYMETADANAKSIYIDYIYIALGRAF